MGVDVLGFAALAAVLVAIPGPAVTLVMKQSVIRGRPAALRTALGVFSADLVWVGASVVGLTAVVVASQPVFEAVRFLGAAYLCWLGVGLLLRRRGADHEAEDSGRPRGLPVISPFAEGAMCDLSNPKTLLVFTSVIPQFLPADGATPVQAAVLGLVFASVGLLSLLIYAAAFSLLGVRGLSNRLGDTLLRVSGAVLVAFGIRFAVEPAK